MRFVSSYLLQQFCAHCFAKSKRDRKTIEMLWPMRVACSMEFETLSNSKEIALKNVFMDFI